MPNPSRYYSSTAAKTTLSNSISAGSSSLQLAAASNLPSLYPYTLILEKDTANEEVVEVTGLVGTSYQITRNIDGSGAKSHAVGALVEHGVSARDFTESRAHEVASSAHNVTGNIVGTGGTQTLTDKTLTSPIISGSPVITGLSSAGMVDSSATPKNYVDSILGSAIAASTSATSAALSAASAATSASSSLTSQSSAATSATSALNSQTAAATSAASALTSQSSAAISASSALTSQTAAATSATSASNSASAAATSASSAATSATSAANSATAAAASVSAIATYASNAATSATSAATSATSAANSATAAATSATSAAGSATTAANSAATATTSAAGAVTSAASAATSAASALVSQTAAATSATSADASANAASFSATAAATSATSASASQSAAATSAASASNSQTLAATSAGQAATSASSAATSAGNAAASQTAAATSASSAATSATAALGSETAAATSAASAATSATSAATSASSALTSATSAATSATSANLSAALANEWATSMSLVAGTDYSAKYYAAQANTGNYLSKAGGTMTGDLILNADPTNALGAATKQYVDGAIAGLSWKEAVHLMSTSNVALTGTASTLVIDSHPALDSTDAGYRILLIGQTTDSQNGIYTYGESGGSYSLTRSTDADAYGELVGASVFVTEGTVYGKTSWVQTNHYLTSFSGQTWFQFSGTGTYNAGTGLTLDGSIFKITNTAVTAGTYANATVQVNAQGQITSASTGTAPVTTVAGTTGRISSTGGTTPVLDLVTTAVTAGTYAAATITVDGYGRVTSASATQVLTDANPQIFMLMGA